jgi:hypothetical protein
MEEPGCGIMFTSINKQEKPKRGILKTAHQILMLILLFSHVFLVSFLADRPWCGGGSEQVVLELGYIDDGRHTTPLHHSPMSA